MKIRMTFVVLAGIGLCQTAAANTIHVCPTCAHKTIQAAVHDALSGDLISIAAGHYIENVTIEGKQLTLQGDLGSTSGVTEVLAAGAGPVFTLGSGVAGSTPELIVIRNLVISQGNHTGGTGVGGGVQVRAGASLHLYDSTVRKNNALQGGGIGVNSPGAPETIISNCLIDDNTAIGKFDAQGGGGVAVKQGSELSIEASTITHNSSFGGGGVFSESGAKLTMSNSIVGGNTSSAFGVKGSGISGGDGGGLTALGSFTITGSTFVNNVADAEGDGGGGLFLALDPADTHLIADTIIARNSLTGTVREGGGIAAFNALSPQPSDLSLSSVFIVENAAGEGGGIFTKGGVTLSLTNTTVKGNSGGQICDDTGCN